jgi:hypothetical protein
MPAALLLSLVATMLCLAVIGVGAVLLRRGLRGNLVDDHDRCRHCGYDLDGTPRRPDLCTECGRSLLGPGKVTVGRRRWRGDLITVGVALVLLPVALVVVAVAPDPAIGAAGGGPVVAAVPAPVRAPVAQPAATAPARALARRAVAARSTTDDTSRAPRAYVEAIAPDPARGRANEARVFDRSVPSLDRAVIECDDAFADAPMLDGRHKILPSPEALDTRLTIDNGRRLESPQTVEEPRTSPTHDPFVGFSLDYGSASYQADLGSSWIDAFPSHATYPRHALGTPGIRPGHQHFMSPRPRARSLLIDSTRIQSTLRSAPTAASTRITPARVNNLRATPRGSR